MQYGAPAAVRAVIKSYKLKQAEGVRKYMRDGAHRDDPDGTRSEYYLGDEDDHFAELNGSGWADVGMTMERELSDLAFDRLLRGMSPDGDVLVPPKGGKHVPGWDIQTSPPKSVSAAFVDASEQERRLLTELHHRANRRVVDYIEQNAKTANVKKTLRGGAHLLVYTTSHHTARATIETRDRGQEGGDPQLHSHNVFFNVQFWEGKPRAVENQGIVHTLKAAEAMYTLEMLEGLDENRIEVEFPTNPYGEPIQDRNGRWTFELKDSDARVRKFWSTRGNAVNRLVRDFEKEHGRGPNIEENIDLARQERGKHSHAEPTWEHYADVREAAGLPKQKIRYGKRKQHRDPKQAVFERLVAPNGLTLSGPDFYRYEIPAAVYNACIGLLGAAEAVAFLDEFLESDELRLVVPSDSGDPDYDRLTTATLERQERWAADLAVTKHRAVHDAPSEIGIRRHIRRAPVALTDEQAHAVEQLAGPSGLVVLAGEAGTGKTTVLRTVIDACRAEETVDRVICVSTARLTAIRSGQKIGADIAGSVEALLVQNLELNERDIVFIDESVMMDTPRFVQLLRLAEKARVRLIGDPHQLQAIGPGGLHVEISERVGYVPLTEVFRQRHEWYINACRALRTSNPMRALDLIDDYEGWHEVDSQAEAIGALVGTWAAYREQGLKPEDILVVTDQPNVVIDTINRLIQDRRLKAGEIGGNSLTIHDERNNRTETYYRGDLYVFRESVGQGRHAPKNGTRGVIVDVNPRRCEIVVEYDKARHVTVPLTVAGNQPGHLAYGGHATLMQGHEGEVVLSLPHNRHTDAVSGYMMVSRGKELAHVFTSREMFGDDPKETLGRLWAEFDPKLLISRRIDWEEARAAELRDLHQETADADDLAFSADTAGWHMGQRIREQMQRRRSTSPDFGIGRDIG